MKKLIWTFLTIALILSMSDGAKALFDNLTFEQLIQAQELIAQEMTTRPEWREVTVPQGVWEVGKDIPAGHWRITAYPETYARVKIGDILTQSLQDISFNSKFFLNESIVSPSYRNYHENVDKTSLDVDLYAGLYVIVDSASVVFTPYTGKTPLGFFSVPFSKSEKLEVGSTTVYKLEPGLYCVGDDIPGGTYDVRYGDGDQPVKLTYSDMLSSDGKPDLNFFYSYTISAETQEWTGGAHPVIMLNSYGYLLIEGRSCRLYPVEMGY